MVVACGHHLLATGEVGKPKIVHSCSKVSGESDSSDSPHECKCTSKDFLKKTSGRVNLKAAIEIEFIDQYPSRSGLRGDRVCCRFPSIEF